MRVTLVGETNPLSAEPEFALWPAPDGCSGHRLCTMILDMPREEYLAAFDRCNLCTGSWSDLAAMLSAQALKRRGGKMVLLGTKVAKAFSLRYAPLAVAHGLYLMLPHPSGLCRAWNDPALRARARELVHNFRLGAGPDAKAQVHEPDEPEAVLPGPGAVLPPVPGRDEGVAAAAD